MNRSVRYFFFALVFGLVLIGLLTKSFGLLLVSVLAAVILGLFTERVDNKKDEKFKPYNKIHPHFP